MGKRKRKLTLAEKAEKKRRQREYMTIFVNGKQKRVKREPMIDGGSVAEFVSNNADPTWLHQNGMYEDLHEWEQHRDKEEDNYRKDAKALQKFGVRIRERPGQVQRLDQPRYTPPMSDSSTLRPTPSNQFSFSRLKTFHQCAFRYRLRYLKGIKEAFRSIESYLGNTVHDVLEWLYGERNEGRNPELPEVLERFEEAWRQDWPEDVAIIRTNEGPDVYYRRGREMLEQFHSEVFATDRSETLALEQRFSKSLSERISFTGFADRVGRTAKGVLFVVDYKTSKNMGDPSDFSEGLQAPLYAACALENHNDEVALAGYHYLRHGKSSWQEVNREKGRELLERFKDMAEAALDKTEFPAKPGILCAWCGFNHICTFAEVPEAFSGGRRLTEENMGAFSNGG